MHLYRQFLFFFKYFKHFAISEKFQLNSSTILTGKFYHERPFALKSYKVKDMQFPRSTGDGGVCLGSIGPLSSGTLWRRGRKVRRTGAQRKAGITSFSGRSVKLRRQVEGQHPHNATAEHHRRLSPHHIVRSSASSSRVPSIPLYLR